MNTLVGEALDQDEEFWKHDTWNEDDDEISDADASYDVEEEKKEDIVDRFDSDFNDSESSEEEDNGQEDEELARAEREGRSKKAVYSEPVTSRKKKGMYKKDKYGVRRHIMAGDGANAGLVLGMPGKKLGKRPVASATAAVSSSYGAVTAPATAVARVATKKQVIVPTQRTLRAKTIVKSVEAQTKLNKQKDASAKRKAALKNKGGASSSSSKKSKKRKFTQEELLVEAATITEPENELWILARKRERAQAEIEFENSMISKKNSSFGCRFRSKRGYFNTLTFPSVDQMPEIFKRPHNPQKLIKTTKSLCAISGKPARYRDPKTGMPYHDLAAFKELRRRHERNEPVKKKDVPTKSKNMAPIIKIENSGKEVVSVKKEQLNCTTNKRRHLKRTAAPASSKISSNLASKETLPTKSKPITKTAKVTSTSSSKSEKNPSSAEPVSSSSKINPMQLPSIPPHATAINPLHLQMMSMHSFMMNPVAPLSIAMPGMHLPINQKNNNLNQPTSVSNKLKSTPPS